MAESRPDKPVTISDDQLASIIERFWSQAKTYRQQHDGDWGHWMDFYKGRNLWPTQMPRFRTKIYAHRLRRILFHKVGMLTANRPKIVVEPLGRGATSEGAQQFQDALDSIAFDQLEPLGWSQFLLLASIYGVANRKTWYDPWDNPPFGRIRSGPINPAYVYPDP